MKVSASTPDANALALLWVEIGSVTVCGGLGSVCAEAPTLPQGGFAADEPEEISCVKAAKLARQLRGPSLSDAVRPVEELTPPTWHNRSLRRPKEHAHLAGLDDDALFTKLAWVRKHRAHGLSSLDLAIQTEFQSRCVAWELYGRDFDPTPQAWLRGELSELGTNAPTARMLLGLLQDAILRGRAGVYLSVDDISALTGASRTQIKFWTGLFEELEILVKVPMYKPSKVDRPCETDKQAYVPGPWLIERIPAILGTGHWRTPGPHRDAAQKARAGKRSRVKDAKRRFTAEHRDRNRERLEGLEPLVFSTDVIEGLCDGIAELGQQEAEVAYSQAAEDRAQRLAQGEMVTFGDDDHDELHVTPCLSVGALEALERLATEHLVEQNRGVRDGSRISELPVGIRPPPQQAGELTQTDRNPVSPAENPDPVSPDVSTPNPRLAAQPTSPSTSDPFPTQPISNNRARDGDVALEGEASARPPNVVDPSGRRANEPGVSKVREPSADSPRSPTPWPNAQAPPVLAQGPPERQGEATPDEITSLFAELVSTEGALPPGWSKKLFG